MNADHARFVGDFRGRKCKKQIKLITLFIS